MQTYVFGVQTYAVFETSQQGRLWMLHFIWGKKDFRIYVGHCSDEPRQLNEGAVLLNQKDEEMVITRLQYCHAFQWYDYLKVAGHGLEYEETKWQRGNARRYVELPHNFYDTAVNLACMQFQLVSETENQILNAATEESAERV